MNNANVWSVEDVMSRACRPGKRILLLDDGGNWRGCGTAWYLAERDYEVTLLTPEAMVGKELVRSAADFPLRSVLKQLGVEFITDSALGKWHGDAATIVSLLDSSERREDYDSLILATPNVAETALFDALANSGLECHAVGDCVAPRWAVHAIYEGRKLGLSL
jgi:NADPH-dependent 2,4-dienoyl-CoA reductase/sulfur reductase-like enzyme